MCGSRPDADDVTKSTGTGVPGFSFCAVSAAALTASTSFLLVGPRFVPPELVASYPVPAADGRERKYPADENACPMMRDASGIAFCIAAKPSSLKLPLPSYLARFSR
jgi:hypothetical protein